MLKKTEHQPDCSEYRYNHPKINLIKQLNNKQL